MRGRSWRRTAAGRALLAAVCDEGAVHVLPKGGEPRCDVQARVSSCCKRRERKRGHDCSGCHAGRCRVFLGLFAQFLLQDTSKHTRNQHCQPRRMSRRGCAGIICDLKWMQARSVTLEHSLVPLCYKQLTSGQGIRRSSSGTAGESWRQRANVPKRANCRHASAATPSRKYGIMFIIHLQALARTLAPRSKQSERRRNSRKPLKTKRAVRASAPSVRTFCVATSSPRGRVEQAPLHSATPARPRPGCEFETANVCSARLQLIAHCTLTLANITAIERYKHSQTFSACARRCAAAPSTSARTSRSGSKGATHSRSAQARSKRLTGPRLQGSW